MKLPLTGRYHDGSKSARYWLALILASLHIMLPLASSQTIKHLYMIGGHCTGRDWISRLSQNGMRQLAEYHPKRICSEEANPESLHPYTNNFLRDGLDRVVKEVGVAGLRETVVIGGCNTLVEDDQSLDECFHGIVELMKLGMGLISFYHETTVLNFTQHQLSTDDVLYMSVPFENHTLDLEAAHEIGRELCRLKQGSAVLKVAKVYDDYNGMYNYRLDSAFEAFQNECPDVEALVVWELRNWTYEANPRNVRAKLLRETPDVIFTTFDGDAKQLLLTAKNILPSDEYQRLRTTGWGNAYPELVREHKILMTIDNMAWQRVLSFLDLVDKHGVKTTRDWQDKFGLEEDEFKVELPLPTLISSDPEGYLLETLKQAYDSRTPPSPTVNVSTGLLNVSVTNFLPFQNHFEAKLTTIYSWTDPRLRWDDFIYNGYLQMDREEIWTPDLFFENDYGSDIGDIFLPPANVYSNGTVVLETMKRTEFLCATLSGMRWYPFDSYQCSMDLTHLQSWIGLDAKWGFGMDYCDSYFACKTGIQESTNVINYQIYFERKQITGWFRLVIPGFLINLVGFMSFWIPEQSESVAVGVTSLLCTIAFRSTVETPSTADMTWSEWFLILNVVYQFMVLFIIYCSYSEFLATRMDSCLQSICGCLHPNQYGVPKEKDEECASSEPAEENKETVGSKERGGLQRRKTSTKQPQRFEIYKSSHHFQLDEDELGRSARRHSLVEVQHDIPNVDWFGRWFVVPSYFLWLAILLITPNTR